MNLRRPQLHPGGAFVLTLFLAALFYCCTLLVLPLGVNVLSNPEGHALLVWAPVALCGMTYSMTVADSSPLIARFFRTAAASTLAPSLAFAFTLFVGFVWFDWEM